MKTMYRLDLDSTVIQDSGFAFFSFSKKYQWFYPSISEECGLNKMFNVNYTNTLSLLCPTVVRKYHLRKHVNTFKARSQASAITIWEWIN